MRVNLHLAKVRNFHPERPIARYFQRESAIAAEQASHLKVVRRRAD